MLDIPTITTERLILRPMQMTDWPRYADLMGSERAVFMGGPFALKEAWGMFCHDVAQWALLGHGALMFDDRQNNQPLGQVAVNAGPLYPEREIGWFVYPEAEGKGYASEAAIAMRHWAFETLKLNTLVSYMDANNIRSANLAKKMGAVLDINAARTDPRDLVFRHPTPSNH